LEVRVGCGDLAEFVQDLHELAEVRLFPVAPRALALLEDGVDGSLGRGEIGHRDQLRPVEVLARGLGASRSDEQVLLAELLRQVRQAVLDRAVEMSNGGEVLRLRDDVVFGHQGHRVVDWRVDALRAVELHPLGALEEHEVLERGLAEWHQRQVDACRVVMRRRRQVRAAEVRSGADR
jgi:hypothetical protein